MNIGQRVGGSFLAATGVFCFAAGMTAIAEHRDPWVSFVCASIDVSFTVWVLTQPAEQPSAEKVGE